MKYLFLVLPILAWLQLPALLPINMKQSQLFAATDQFRNMHVDVITRSIDEEFRSQLLALH
jgi:hypothetical protein